MELKQVKGFTGKSVTSMLFIFFLKIQIFNMLLKYNYFLIPVGLSEKKLQGGFNCGQNSSFVVPWVIVGGEDKWDTAVNIDTREGWIVTWLVINVFKKREMRMQFTVTKSFYASIFNLYKERRKLCFPTPKFSDIS